MNIEGKKYFVGQQEIVRVEIPREGWVTYTILYPNMQGEKEEVTETVTQEQFEAIASDVPYADGEVAIRQWKTLLTELMALFLKYDVQMADKEFVINQLRDSLTENYRKAVAKLFKRKHVDFVRMSQIDEVLKSDTPFLKD